MRALLLIIAALAALGLVACADDTKQKVDAPVVHQEGGPHKEASATDRASDRTVTPTCVQVCTTDNDCVSPNKLCDTGKGTCIMCKADGDCETSLYKGGCNTATGVCKLCKVDSDCAAGKGCDAASGICKGCTSDADCTGGTKILSGKCDTATVFQCMKCDSDPDCVYTGSPGKYCGSRSLCVACKADSDCAGAATGLKGCDTILNTCTRCTADAECCGTKTAPCGITCNKTSRTCECKDTAACTNVLGSKPPYVCK